MKRLLSALLDLFDAIGRWRLRRRESKRRGMLRRLRRILSERDRKKER